MNNVFIGEFIQQRRLDLGLTQAQVCEGICEPVTISRIENGHQTPSRNRINAILQCLGLPDDRYYALLSKEELKGESIMPAFSFETLLYFCLSLSCLLYFGSHTISILFFSKAAAAPPMTAKKLRNFRILTVIQILLLGDYLIRSQNQSGILHASVLVMAILSILAACFCLWKYQ